MEYSINKERNMITVTPDKDKKHNVSASGSNDLLCVENIKLPCDVKLSGGGIIRKNCKLSTLILAINNKIKYGST